MPPIVPRYSLSLSGDALDQVPSPLLVDIPSPSTGHDVLPSVLSRRLHRLPLSAGQTAAPGRLAQLSPVVATPPFDTVGRRRCSSPGAFLHMIREDETLRWDVGDFDEGVSCGSDRSVERKTSLGLDDSGSPMNVCEAAWSRKTSSTSGYSESMAGGESSQAASRKTSLADDERAGVSPERSPGADFSLPQCIELGDRHLVVPPPTFGPRNSSSVPTFQLVIDDVDLQPKPGVDFSHFPP